MRKLSTDEIRLLNTMKGPGNERIPTAIYARKSKEDRSQDALKVQVETCQKLIEANAEYFELINVYQEAEASGKDIEGREEFKKLLKETEEGTIKVIVVSKWDRLSRSTQDTLTLRDTLPKKGVLIITIEDTGQQDAASTLHRDFMAAISQFYLQKISEDTKSVLIHKASKGQSAGGRANFGYEYYKNQQGEIRLRQNPLEAITVKEIFERYNAGWSYQDIIDDLKKRNITTRAGNAFTRSTIHDILRNVKYAGVYRYNRQDRIQKTITPKHYEEVWVEDGIENPIISKELFDQTQEKLAINVGQKKASEYILTGILTCEECGAQMVGSSQSRGKGKTRVRYYICPNHQSRRGSTCSNKGITASKIEEYVENAVFKFVKAYIKSDSVDENIFEDINQNEKARIRSINTSIKNYEENKRKILDLLLDDPEEATKKALNQRLQEFQIKIDQLGEAVKEIQKDVDATEKIYKDFEKANITKDSLFPTINAKKTIVHTIVDKIVLGENIELHILEDNEGSE